MFNLNLFYDGFQNVDLLQIVYEKARQENALRILVGKPLGKRLIGKPRKKCNVTSRWILGRQVVMMGGSRPTWSRSNAYVILGPFGSLILAIRSNILIRSSWLSLLHSYESRDSTLK